MKPPLRKALSFIAGDLGSRVLGFFITVYLARMLGPSSFGVFNIGLAVLGYLLLAVSPGIQVLETRNVASTPGVDRKRIEGVLSVRVMLALGLFGLTWATGSLFIESNELRAVVIVLAASLFPFSLLLDWFYQGKERFTLVAASKIMNSLAFGITALVLVVRSEDTAFAAAAFAIGSLASTVLLLVFFLSENFVPTFGWQKGMWKSILGASVPVGLAAFLGQSAIILPPLVIGIALTQFDVGIYSAAMKVVYLLLMFDRVINALFLPVVTRHFAQQSQELPFLVNVSVKSVIVIGFPLMVIGMILSPWGVDLIFGSGYGSAVPVVRILLWYFFLTIINSILVCVLFAAGAERSYTWGMGVGSGVMAALIIVLTIAFGAEGSALGVVLGELLTVILMVRKARRHVELPLAGQLLRPFVACCVMFLAAQLTRGIDAFVAVGVVLAVYLIVIIVGKGLKSEEIRYLREKFV